MKDDLSHLSEPQRLATEAWRLIKNNPARWNQDYWRKLKTQCGTELCWGGHAVTLAGGKFITNNPDSTYFDKLLAESGDPEHHKITKELGDLKIELTTVAGRLVNLLGITESQVCNLTRGSNSLANLRDYIIDYLKVDPETGKIVEKVPCWCGNPDCINNG